jgi:hypothetical protein
MSPEEEAKRQLYRPAVYDIINTERDYQDRIVDPDPDRRGTVFHSVGDFGVMLHEYMNRFDRAWVDGSGTNDALDVVRKIAAICVKCMEIHGARARQF